jgi:hypothetical protein
MEETMLKHSLTAAAALVMLGAVAIAPAQAWSRATHHKTKHHQANTTLNTATQNKNEITSFSSSSGVVTGGVGINHPSRK